MPSLAMAETVAPTETIHAISGSTLAAERFKALIETPLNFEIAKSPVSMGLNGRYTPLNKPFQMPHGTGGGLSNGAAGASVAASAKGEGTGPSENGDGASVHINGAPVVKEDVISTEWPKIFPRPPGLKNFMNTCYMNSTLQALMHIPPLVAYLLKETHSRQCSRLPRSCAFCRLERHARESYPPTPQRQPYLIPHNIIGREGVCNKFYSIYKQEDAHEFLLGILDKMDEAEKRVHNNPKHRSIIQRIFEGEFRQTITCDVSTCSHVSHTPQPFQDLGLDILPPRERDLQSSLQAFVRPEVLSHDNLYKCEKCGGQSRAKKRVTIHTAPPILAVHLKRFSASGLRKNGALVDYPEELDLNPYISEETKGVGMYRLIATVCHVGFDYSGMLSGHYIAKCKSSSGTWNEFDDTNVYKLGLENVLKDRNAYILFYARDDPGKSRPPTVNGIYQSPSIAPSDKFNVIPSSPGTKRPSTEKLTPPECPKRRKVADDISDEEVESAKPGLPKPRKPLGDVNNTTNSPSVPMKTTAYDKQSIKQSRPNTSQTPTRPLGPKEMPSPSRALQPSRSTFFEQLRQNDPAPPPSVRKQSIQVTKPATQGPQVYRPDKPRRQPQLETTTQNPASKDDPFVDGYTTASSRQAKQSISKPPGIKYPGIQSQIQPGANEAYNRDPTSGKGKSMAQQRNELGIKTNRKH